MSDDFIFAHSYILTYFFKQIFLCKVFAESLNVLSSVKARSRSHRFDHWVGKIPGEGNDNPLYNTYENLLIAK